jgi:methyltransferase OMS1
MVDVARKKFEELEETKNPAQRFQGRVGFIVGDAAAQSVIEKPSEGFDTIVQTMGLCSTRDPVGLLKRLGELCKKPSVKRKGGGSNVVSGKQTKYEREVVKQDGEYDGGRILLLEHGRGHYDWLNHVLDGLAPAHADHYGCWWNRDIGAMVEQSGLEIEYVKRYHLGTTWEVVLRPKVDQETPARAESDGQKNESKSSGIFGWMFQAREPVGPAISRR